MSYLPTKFKLGKITLLITFFLFLSTTTVFAQQGPPPPQSTAGLSTGVSDNNTLNGWVQDKDVTFAGQSVLRASSLLNWVLTNYQWSNISTNLQKNKNEDIPLRNIFLQVQSVIYALLSLMILIGAFVIIFTRGQNLTLKKFALKFALVTALVFLSFAIVSGIYVIFDIFQSFFLRVDTPQAITAKSLLNVAPEFNYTNFIGLRQADIYFEEAVFTSTLLVKLTAITYYTMFVILITRKIIMWFFIVASPIFPLLLLFSPLRGTAKVWIGQFFYWVLYGPLFAIFLFALVSLWQSVIPLNLAVTSCQGGGSQSPTDPTKFPSGTNIMLGGPCQKVDFDNNLSTPDTFIQFIVALVMLWVVIFLPFVFLKVFLNYFQNLTTSSESGLVKSFIRASSPLIKKYRQATESSSNESISQSKSYKSADNLPTFKHSPVEEMQSSLSSLSTSTQDNLTSTIFKHSPLDYIKVGPQISQPFQNQTNQNDLTTPKTTDLALDSLSAKPVTFGGSVSDRREEISRLTSKAKSGITPAVGFNPTQTETKILNQTNLPIPTLSKIAEYETASISESHPLKEEMLSINNTLGKIAGKDHNMSSSEKERYGEIKTMLVSNIPLSSHISANILEATKSADQANLPETNQIQVVSQEEYEKVKKTWKEHYTKLTPPKNPDGTPQERQNWIYGDMIKIQTAIDLLSSKDPEYIKKGKEMVSKILPLILLGGFSQTELISYLKAKLEVAREATYSSPNEKKEAE